MSHQSVKNVKVLILEHAMYETCLFRV